MAIPCVPIPKSQVICRKQKKKRFFAFFVVPLEIFSSACQLDNIDASRLHDSSFENLCPKVSKTHVEVFDTFKILSPIPLRSQKIQICVPQKIVFGQFCCCWGNTCFDPLWRSLRSWIHFCPKALAKFWRSDGWRKSIFALTSEKLRSTAFQRCISCGGVRLVEMGQKSDFLKKSA